MSMMVLIAMLALGAVAVAGLAVLAVVLVAGTRRRSVVPVAQAPDTSRDTRSTR